MNGNKLFLDTNIIPPRWRERPARDGMSKRAEKVVKNNK